MKPLVIYFSPTGGTENVAKLIAAELGAESVDVTVFDYGMSFGPDDLVFFCFPVYGGRIPSPMYSRMRNVSGQGSSAVPVAVFGNRAVDDALIEMSDLCKKQGFKTVAACEMIAPHSLDRHYGAGRPDARDIAQLRQFLKKLAGMTSFAEISVPGSHDYKKYDGVPFRPSSGKDCTGCGTCAAECPTGAIDPSDPMNPDKSKCISCMRCVSVCPSKVRKLPAPMRLAASVALRKLCSGRKEPKFYL